MLVGRKIILLKWTYVKSCYFLLLCNIITRKFNKITMSEKYRLFREQEWLKSIISSGYSRIWVVCYLYWLMKPHCQNLSNFPPTDRPTNLPLDAPPRSLKTISSNSTAILYNWWFRMTNVSVYLFYINEPEIFCENPRYKSE